MLLALVLSLLLSCSKQESLQSIIKDGSKACQRDNLSKRCQNLKSKLALLKPTTGEWDFILEECEKENRFMCALAAYYYREEQNIEKAKRFAIKACRMGDVNACITGWDLSEESRDKYEYSDLACELGDSKSCSDKVIRLIELDRESEAMELGVKLCLSGSGIDCYNIACLNSRSGNIANAKMYLKKATHFGFKEWEHFSNDPDLKNLKKELNWEQFEKELGKDF
ncbi:MAG: hypothetical protein CME71_00630 [Halobacteriovorax sp.]|nr:hypothetical protein [Halobacteriovorax sp.]